MMKDKVRCDTLKIRINSSEKGKNPNQIKKEKNI